MAEYIEREAAFNAILKLVPKVDDDGYCWVIRGDAATAIDSIPTADVRPVVLCRDCKYWEYDTIFAEGWCRGRRQENPNWYCADGEKMEES